MSDYSGLCTFCAEGAEAAAHRMSVSRFAGAQFRMEASMEIFVQASDLVVRVGWLASKRKILGVWETVPEMKAGEVEMLRINRHRQ